MKKNNAQKGSIWIMFAMTILLWGSSLDIQAAAPSGVLKQAIHWGISADWLDPATGGHASSGFLTLYLFHDALVKPMPDGSFSFLS